MKRRRAAPEGSTPHRDHYEDIVRIPVINGADAKGPDRGPCVACAPEGYTGGTGTASPPLQGVKALHIGRALTLTSPSPGPLRPQAGNTWFLPIHPRRLRFPFPDRSPSRALGMAPLSRWLPSYTPSSPPAAPCASAPLWPSAKHYGVVCPSGAPVDGLPSRCPGRPCAWPVCRVGCTDPSSNSHSIPPIHKAGVPSAAPLNQSYLWFHVARVYHS